MHIRRYISAVAVALLALACIWGCGGTGGAAQNTVANAPQVSIAWPARTRSISAPNSALSFSVTLQSTGGSNKFFILGNRPAGLSPTTTSYGGSVAAAAGSYQLTGTFYSEPGESGSIVGTVSAPVLVQSNGTVLNASGQPLQLTFVGTIKSVIVDPDQVVNAGSTITLAATAFDSSGNAIVVTAGSFSFALSGSSADLSVQVNGNATGLANGSALVTASVDGLTSSPALVVVGPSNPGYNAFAVAAADIAYDPSRNVLYAACTPQSSYAAGLISTIELGSNQFGPTLPVTNTPNHLAVSGDEKYVYVTGLNGTVQRVNLTTDLVDATVSLPAGTVANQILTLPGQNESFAISLISSSNDLTDEGVVILDGTTFRAKPVKLGLSIDTNSSGSRIYGYELYKSSGATYSSANLTSAGIVGVQTRLSSVQGPANRIHWDNSKIIFDSGQVVDPDSGNLLGQFPLPPYSTLAVPMVGTDVVYFLSGSPYEVNRYSLSSLTLNDTIQISGPNGYPQRAISLGTGRIGFHTVSGNPSAVYAIAGLP